MKLLLLLAFILVIGFAVAAKIIFSVKSISETWYHLERWRKGAGLIFTAWCITPAFILFPLWVVIMPSDSQFVSFLAVCALAAVGCTPKYLGVDKIAHFVSAMISAILSIAACALCGLWLLPLVIIVPVAIWIVVTKRDDDLYWAEVAALACVFISIAIKIW